MSQYSNKLRVETRNNTIRFGDHFQVTLHRTLRIPDTHKTYSLPISVGHYPVHNVDEYADNPHMPEAWLKHGGVFTVMNPNDAMWIGFGGSYAHAVKIAFGKINAITGGKWHEKFNAHEQDYLVAPRPQYWFDGINFGNMVVRQIVAANMGEGKTVEGQVTGKETVGGLQLMVAPGHTNNHIERISTQYTPNIIPTNTGALGNSAYQIKKLGHSTLSNPRSSLNVNEYSGARGQSLDVSASVEMSIAAGGKIKQTLYNDTYGSRNWSTSNAARCFVHIASPELWQRITSEAAHAPMTKEEYERRGYAWIEKWDNISQDLKASTKLNKVKSVGQIASDSGHAPDADIDKGISTNYQQIRDGEWW